MNSFPKWLYISPSIWYGTTLYTLKKIPKGYIIGITDVCNYDKEEGCIKTKYGNVFNSTDCVKDVNVKMIIQENNLMKIVATKDINSGDELLLEYK